MYKKEINIDEKFGEWIVLEQLEQRKNGYILYRCKCSCGNEAIHNGNYLRDLKSEYCRSCSAKKRIPKGKKCKFYKHGAAMYSNDLRPTYSRWLMMRQRCNNPNCKDYVNYGSRGIKVCPEWDDFNQFVKDMGKAPKGLSIERINNDGDYTPKNCRWATREQQNNNRRDNTTFVIDGVRVTRSQIQKKLDWTRDMYRRRSEKHGTEWIVEQYKNSL